MTRDYDFIVAGAGMVGAAIAYGLAGMGRRVLMLDGADTDFRAAKANFGLIGCKARGSATRHISACPSRLRGLASNSRGNCRRKATWSSHMNATAASIFV